MVCYPGVFFPSCIAFHPRQREEEGASEGGGGGGWGRIRIEHLLCAGHHPQFLLCILGDVMSLNSDQESMAWISKMWD